MVSSTASRPRRGRISNGFASVLVTAVFVLSGPNPASAFAPIGTAVPSCSSNPPNATVVAGIPWPQTRFDVTGLSQLTEGAGVTVAVLDSGVDTVNPQLTGQVVGGADMLDPSGDGRLDCIGHGTAVASIIAGRSLTGVGLRGLAPAARILPVRVSERVETGEGATGAGGVAELVAGIREAVRRRPQVMNLSISTTSDTPELRAAVQAALDADIVVVAAAGNAYRSGNPRPYPAGYDGVVGVGAITADGQRVATSQVGSYVDIVAPGDAVIGAAPRAGHLAYSGTSFAAPFVAATAALIRARYPRLDRTEVVRRLLATADPAAGARPSDDYGFGVVNPMRALTELLPPAAAPAPADPTPALTAGQGTLDRRPSPTPPALLAAVALLLATAAVAGFAAALPAARRRHWRPGRLP